MRNFDEKIMTQYFQRSTGAEVQHQQERSLPDAIIQLSSPIYAFLDLMNRLLKLRERPYM